MDNTRKIIRWNDEKNEFLKSTRGIGFEVIESLIEEKIEIDIIYNPNYPNQRIFIFEISNYIVAVPFVETEFEIFLKTLFRSRKLNKHYEGKNHEAED